VLKELKALNQMYNLISKEGELFGKKARIKLKLSHLRDIRATLKRILTGSLLDDIELFEIKRLAILNDEIIELAGSINADFLNLSSLSGVIDILDPEKKRINSFYIYDQYNPELKGARAQLRIAKEPSQELLLKISKLEEEVREKLSGLLREYYDELMLSLMKLSEIDILIAKAELIDEFSLSIPQISDNNSTIYHGMFNPEISELLKNNGLKFQPVDISFTSKEPLLITGSNMGGKSVTLRTLALCQYLFQFGFAVPAEFASVSIVNSIHLSAGDSQDYRKGISSFAGELININNILKEAEREKNLLALIDEPASATNPREGSALAAALIKILKKRVLYSVVTTHYNLDNVECSKLKVVGLKEGKMDYTLTTIDGGAVPYEAIETAESIGIDKEWLNQAKKELDTFKI